MGHDKVRIKIEGAFQGLDRLADFAAFLLNRGAKIVCAQIETVGGNGAFAPNQRFIQSPLVSTKGELIRAKKVSFRAFPALLPGNAGSPLT